MAENYESAALRHFDDADTLRANGRMDNAGHLVGFAAECAIKHQICSLQGRVHCPLLHFPEILIPARKLQGPRSGYTEMYKVLKGDIFKSWSVHRRYHETGNTDLSDLTQWFADTRRLFATAGLKVRK